VDAKREFEEALALHRLGDLVNAQKKYRAILRRAPRNFDVNYLLGLIFLQSGQFEDADACIKFWQGETFQLQKGLTLVRGGGHFPGGAMLHWAAGGAVCSADMAIANLDRKSFAFMRSIPNFIPLSEKAVRAVSTALMPLAFDRVYSHHFERLIQSDAKQILQRSAERYIAAISGAYDRA
jgi:glyoxylase-like metal-dependent hydrolase (beta-lactamase superfamily II)